MEFKVEDGPTFKALAQNILAFLRENSDTIFNDERHIIVLANGSGIKIHLLTDTTYSIFPAFRTDSGYWMTMDTGGFIYSNQVVEGTGDPLRAIRVVSMRAWKNCAAVTAKAQS